MSGMIRTLVLAAIIGLSGSACAAPPLKPQTSNQSAVTVKVVPKNVQGDVWEFDMVFDTHSQELKDDLLKNAVLIAVDGTPVAPMAWQGDPPNGHHRKGVLRFNALNPRPDVLELRVTRPTELVPRVFKWDMK